MATLTEAEVKKRRQKTAEAKVESLEETKQESLIKFTDIASEKDIIVNLETKGRFSVPENIQLRPFKTRDVNNIALSRQEKILSVLVQILNECIVPENAFKVEDMLVQEFMELMVGVKLNYSREHDHRWLCECQNGLPVEDQKLCTSKIDLATIKYKSITEADIIQREYIRPALEVLSPQEFLTWCFTTFKDEMSEDEIKNMTLDDALNRLKVSEPIYFDASGHTYTLRFSRVSDLIRGQAEAEKKFAFKFKQLQNRQFKDNTHMTMEQFKYQKEKDLENLKEEQAKYAISVINALRIVEVDGNKIQSVEQAVKIYDDIDTRDSQELEIYLSELQFGVHDEKELICDLCGEPRKRLLQREFDVLELLPMDTSSTRKLSNNSRTTISLGVRI